MYFELSCELVENEGDGGKLLVDGGPPDGDKMLLDNKKKRDC